MYIDFSSFFDQSLRETAGFYPAKSHEQAFLRISDGLSHHHSVFFLSGEQGVGKTHILKRLYRKPEPSLSKAWLSAPCPEVSMMMQSLADLYEIRWDPANPNNLRNRLAHEVKNKQMPVLYVDNVTSLDVETVIKLTGILRWRKQSLAKIVFAGRFELDAVLAMFIKHNDIKAMQCKLYALDESEIHAYLVQLSRVSGYAGKSPFDKSAIHALIKHSRGIPARINRLCDFCLFLARTNGHALLDAGLIDQAATYLRKLNLWLLDNEKSTKVDEGKFSFSQVRGEDPDIIDALSKGTDSHSLKQTQVTDDQALIQERPSGFSLRPLWVGCLLVALAIGITYCFLNYSNLSSLNLPEILQSNSKLNDSYVTLGAKQDAELAQSSERDESTLILAVWNNNAQEVIELIQQGVNVDSANHFGQTPLMIAAMLGNQNIVEMVLKNAADIDRIDNKGLTALMLAARNGQTRIVEYLLNRGADINIQDKRGMTAIMHAASFGHQETVGLILKYMPNLALKNSQAQTADEIALSLGYDAIAGEIYNARTH